MKIICIGRNYAKHAKELGNEVPSEPVIFMKPETALFTTETFTIPSFSSNLHYELEIVVKIDKKGKDIKLYDAREYYSELALGIDFTARDLQKSLKEKGLPWEKAKAFDQSAYVSHFFSKERLTSETEFSLKKNTSFVQRDCSGNMLFSMDQLIENCSKYFTLEPGDLIYTGTPEGVGSIQKEDHLGGYIDNELIFEINIK